MRAKLLACLLPALVIVLAVAASPGSALTRPQTFSVLSVTESFQQIGDFNFERAPQAGDRFTFTDGLYKWAGRKRGARVGHAEVLCTFTKASRSEPFSAFALCSGGFFLPAGQVLIEGFLRFTDGPGDFQIPVVGGTGAYANARGYAHVRDIGPQDTDNSNIEFHLQP
jgi:hypothetical protein